MKLLLPVSHVDLERAEALAHRMVSLGGVWGVDLSVIATMRAKWDIEPIIAALQPGFQTVRLHVLPTECEEGWPESANHLFCGGAEYAARFQDGAPWYWFEADNFPLRPGWFQKITAEYHRYNRPYLGVVNTSRYVNLDTGQQYEDGQHMVGTGVYPADFLIRCTRIHYMTRQPWDVWIGPEVVDQCYPTKLIAHRWGTCNYRLVDGVLHCDDVPHDWHKYAAPIPPEAVVVHGCKDSSLAQLASLL